jgi:hypothetical protein
MRSHSRPLARCAVDTTNSALRLGDGPLRRLDDRGHAVAVHQADHRLQLRTSLVLFHIFTHRVPT